MTYFDLGMRRVWYIPSDTILFHSGSLAILLCRLHLWVSFFARWYLWRTIIYHCWKGNTQKLGERRYLFGCDIHTLCYQIEFVIIISSVLNYTIVEWLIYSRIQLLTFERKFLLLLVPLQPVYFFHHIQLRENDKYSPWLINNTVMS